ncbi:MAG: site-specific integrase [Bacilli bacterium]
MKVVKPPTKDYPEMEFYTESEVNQILEYLEYEDVGFRTAITMLIMGGFRRAELLGLYWEDIDFEKGTVSVKKNLLEMRGKGGVIEDSTKTLKSVRTIKMPNNVFELLKRYKEHQAFFSNKIKALPYVFKSSVGGVMYPAWLIANWKRFLIRYKLKKLRLHDLRHTCATLLISWGIPIATVSKMLGHSNIYTTLNTYTHSVGEDEDSVSKLLEEKFGK